jgi:hypothetical protein
VDIRGKSTLIIPPVLNSTQNAVGVGGRGGSTNALTVLDNGGDVQRSADASGISVSSRTLVAVELAELVKAKEHGLGQEVACTLFLRKELVGAKVESFTSGEVGAGEMTMGSKGSLLGRGYERSGSSKITRRVLGVDGGERQKGEDKAGHVDKL